MTQTPAFLDVSIAAGQVCPFCRAAIEPGQTLVACTACLTVFHAACVGENRACTTLGCGNAARNDEGRPPLARIRPRSVKVAPIRRGRALRRVALAGAAAGLLGLGALGAWRWWDRPPPPPPDPGCGPWCYFPQAGPALSIRSFEARRVPGSHPAEMRVEAEVALDPALSGRIGYAWAEVLGHALALRKLAGCGMPHAWQEHACAQGRPHLVREPVVLQAAAQFPPPRLYCIDPFEGGMYDIVRAELVVRLDGLEARETRDVEFLVSEVWDPPVRPADPPAAAGPVVELEASPGVVATSAFTLRGRVHASTARVRISVHGPEGDVDWEAAPGPFEATVTLPAPGTHEVEVRVSDGLGGTGRASLRVVRVDDPG